MSSNTPPDPESDLSKKESHLKQTLKSNLPSQLSNSSNSYPDHSQNNRTIAAPRIASSPIISPALNSSSKYPNRRHEDMSKNRNRSVSRDRNNSRDDNRSRHRYRNESRTRNKHRDDSRVRHRNRGESSEDQRHRSTSKYKNNNRSDSRDKFRQVYTSDNNSRTITIKSRNAESPRRINSRDRREISRESSRDSYTKKNDSSDRYSGRNKRRSYSRNRLSDTNRFRSNSRDRSTDRHHRNSSRQHRNSYHRSSSRTQDSSKKYPRKNYHNENRNSYSKPNFNKNQISGNDQGYLEHRKELRDSAKVFVYAESPTVSEDEYQEKQERIVLKEYLKKMDSKGKNNPDLTDDSDDSSSSSTPRKKSKKKSSSSKSKKSKKKKSRKSRRPRSPSTSDYDTDSSHERRRKRSKKRSSKKHHSSSRSPSRERKRRSSKKYDSPSRSPSGERKRRSSRKYDSPSRSPSRERKSDNVKSTEKFESHDRGIEYSKESVSNKHIPEINSEDSSDEQVIWVEKPLESVPVKTDIPTNPNPKTFVGPEIPNLTEKQLDSKDFGNALLPGEGTAMAAYVQSGKRIPRRGEIGLKSEEITKFEDSGYVMSGSRHRRMNAVRLRKENQIISAEEKRQLLIYNQDERLKRESKIVSDFREILSSKFSDSKP
ncbi:NKAP-like protein [Smittium culicis]|uniref:NKAP-like protein n=2 Tax=Smittium culicis TaxID=133412 RepID=A0A1R1YEJ9_9FUNG|nr:NKAP-like protein [Smittium culicis]